MVDFSELKTRIKQWSHNLGFQQLGISSIDVQPHDQYLKQWLRQQLHGSMHYMERHCLQRCDPEKLFPGAVTIISVRMNYLTQAGLDQEQYITQQHPYIARYARGRDYHKYMRRQLQKLANQITTVVGSFGYRAFVDSAPVLEKAIAQQARLGWIGKNTLLINQKAGSWFLLGELFTNLPLPIDNNQTQASHCGSCTACLDICPTGAIIGPRKLDARKCIAYLTIENKGAIPVPLRPLIGNRIFGCDDCQLVCPWNKYAQLAATQSKVDLAPISQTNNTKINASYTTSPQQVFYPKPVLQQGTLIDFFLWDEAQYLSATVGSPIRRTGYIGWLRNIAVALGNAPYHQDIITALQQRLEFPSDLVQEHVQWALTQQLQRSTKDHL